MNEGSKAWGRPAGGSGGGSRCLCIPCAVSENDFKEWIAVNGGRWDGGPEAPRALVNGREYSLIYLPASRKVSCARCGEETHWAYYPDAA